MVSHFSSSKTVKPEDLFLDKMPEESRQAFLYCITLPFLSSSSWYLAGGTALALQAGHRQSVDLDFFTPQASFQETHLERKLFETGHWKTSFRQKGTIYGVLKNAKVSFIAYPFFRPSPNLIRCGHVRILQPHDIAAMKIIAISQRGRKRDFVDLYWYITKLESLRNVIVRAANQYPGQKDNMPHILKSLTYFEDAEQDPMPTLFFNATWKQIKLYFRREITKITKEFLGLR